MVEKKRINMILNATLVDKIDKECKLIGINRTTFFDLLAINYFNSKEIKF